MQNIMLVVVVYFAAVEALEIPTGPKITVPTHNSVGEARRLLRSREAAALDNTDNESSPDSDERGPGATWLSRLAQLDQDQPRLKSMQTVNHWIIDKWRPSDVFEHVKRFKGWVTFDSNVNNLSISPKGRSVFDSRRYWLHPLQN
ncbi:hypothetical protein PHYSODRAFT_288498 [Phytophthora sojae]|uniref:RxLR effector protein n=2 Tax=Phytophthora sojae TaxID=67593 RepID=G5A541_PHYSP|nr:hypothetical protein PHYSODRAFT_288498 [Phytophthora sojae]AEK81159.1 Avh318 [Phytophthora sojae]AEK81160.1 Avh318 [Phytophthora sojae]EGZ09790.1 hypothetical protein PHYSODRAFT_288498 [Phytophthora sojae]|eukprot:XP_009534651.1 hypothetical protein PHYSODRAFT_288498 [Phytophthora sojae]